MLIFNTLIDGLIFSIIMGGSICLILKSNPRYEMKSYPKEIVDIVPKQTKEEKRAFLIRAIPTMIILIIYVGYSTFLTYRSYEVSVITLFFHLFTVLMVWNIIDLLVMDWLIFCTITPDFMIMPGTKGNPAYKDYKYHFIGFLKGIVISIVIAIIISIIIYILMK